MKRKLIALLAVTLTSIPVWGQSALATVTSAGQFQLRDAVITPGLGVPSWPVLAGDTIKAGNAITVITFQDGSVIVLDPGAQGTVDVSDGISVFRLTMGSARHSLKSLTSVKLIAGDKLVTPRSVTGSYSQSAGSGFWTPGNVGLAVGVGAATAAGLGVAVSNNSGSAVSPSR